MLARGFGRSLLLAALLALWSGAVANADGVNQSAGVQNKDGNPSPGAGSIQGHSNIDDYTHQDEQINIDASRDNVVKVLRVNQKNLVNDFVVRTFPIENAPPIEVRAIFRNIVALEGGRAEVIRDKVKNQDWLWVTAPKFQMPYIEAAVKELDVSWLKDDLDGSFEAYYKAKFRKAAAIDALAAVPAAGSDHPSVVDAVNNALLRTGEPYRTEHYLKYAAVVDQPIPQLLLDAAVYEVEVSKEMRLGLDYIAWKNGPGRNLFEFVFWGLSYDQTARHITSKFDPFVPERTPVTGTDSLDGHASGRYMAANFLLSAAYIDFLEGVGRARLVTRGKVLIKNNEEGTLSAVDEVLHFVVSPGDKNTPASGIEPALPFQDFEELEEKHDADIPVYGRTLDKDGVIEVGFVMTVKPIIAEVTTQLDIDLNLNNIVGVTPGGTPQVRTYDLSTTVLVRDGQPICAGGLRRTEDVKNTAKAPILGSIPILGYLFGHEANVQRETEMVVVLTPKIRLGSEADMEMANEEDELVRKQVLRLLKLPVPSTQFGFDQWLIDKEM
jgi:type II secretory pathway component GspD/PulD (secretin)